MFVCFGAIADGSNFSVSGALRQSVMALSSRASSGRCRNKSVSEALADVHRLQNKIFV